MEVAFAILAILTIVMFAQDVHQEHYGAHHPINVSMSVDKMQFIHHLLQPAFVSLDTASRMEFVKNVQLITSFLMDSVSLALSTQYSAQLARAVNVCPAFIPIKLVFALRNVEQMKSTTLLLKTALALKVWAKLTECVKFVPLDLLLLQMGLDVLPVVTTKA